MSLRGVAVLRENAIVKFDVDTAIRMNLRLDELLDEWLAAE